jgi:hypothetical protein
LRAQSRRRIEAFQPQLALAERQAVEEPPGTPFIAVTTAVRGPSSGPIDAATSGRLCPFTATIT